MAREKSRSRDHLSGQGSGDLIGKKRLFLTEVGEDTNDQKRLKGDDSLKLSVTNDLSSTAVVAGEQPRRAQ